MIDPPAAPALSLQPGFPWTSGDGIFESMHRAVMPRDCDGVFESVHRAVMPRDCNRIFDWIRRAVLPCDLEVVCDRGTAVFSA